MRYVLVYGAIAGAIVILVLCAGFTFDLSNHASSQWFGYLVMLVALSLIFVGVKRYRDVECGGVIRFGRALAVGLGIAAVAAVVYVIGWELYLAVTGWDFMAEYGASIVEGMRAKGASSAAIAAKSEELRGFAEMYRNPVYRAAMTFAEIFPVGLIVAFLSAAVLRNPRVLPARG